VTLTHQVVGPLAQFADSSLQGRKHKIPASRGERSIEEYQSATKGPTAGRTESIHPLIGPGRFLDAVGLFGRGLTPSDRIGLDAPKKWFADKDEPQHGSFFLVWTGWMRHLSDAVRYFGLTKGLLSVTRDAPPGG
jgi:hypothetical protein